LLFFGPLLQQFLIDFHAEPRARRQTDVTLLVDLAPFHARDTLGIESLIVRVELVDEKEGNGSNHVQTGGNTKETSSTMRRQRHVIGLGNKGDLFHLTDAAAMAAVRLQDVETAVIQISEPFPDGAVAFACCQGNVDGFLETLEYLDVARDCGLLDEQHVK